ncbi:lymphocyte-specific helicase-like [Venturia canescens]|uniref:lymphocyte-specific helicase-like n=1 Tax=Venturia canescens TaxID=32260 RepID=UPI001C9BDF7E|nr:lymphocyte-specific helicase-like [Venturia canescens]
METSNDGVLKELSDNKTGVPEGIGIAEDSGFASIAGSIADSSSKDDSVAVPIAQDVKFLPIDVEQMAVDKGKKRKNLFIDEAKKKAEEEYNNQQREQTYKRLMHLLTKSQFYSSYIIDKINSTDSTKSNKKGRLASKRKVTQESDENVEPGASTVSKRPQRTTRGNKKYDITEYVSADMKKKLTTQKKKKMNLSQEEIESDLNSQSDSEDKDEIEAEFKNPTYFQGILRDYQQEGLKWLKLLYENGVNGILADEMGLGKTIQVIALFCHLLERRQDGPYLIIAPLSTIPNWISEFERFAPNLPVVLFHGSQEARAAAMKKFKVKHKVTETYYTYPILITTYEYPIRERLFMSKFKWRYIVVDEGQRIKNHKCLLVRSLECLKSMNRLLLTGTPLQNNLDELWSLLHFLLPEIFDDLAVFQSWFDAEELQKNDGTEKVLKQEQEKHVLSTLREILKPFMLRREKSDVCLDIPPKKEMIVYAPLTELQHDLYAAVLNHDLQALSKIDEKNLALSEGPALPKRRCRMRNKYCSEYVDVYATADGNSSRSTSPFDDDNDENYDWYRRTPEIDSSANTIAGEKKLDIWRQYTNINERNCEFFIRLRFGNNGLMYKQIVNHPYLLHCPLDASGQPEISENLVKASGKLLVLDAMLKKLKAQGHKVLLFSTMTMILDLIADYLNLRPWQFRMLDGRQAIEVRQENIKAFNEDPDVFLFLISTRAGGVGLNLAGADTVIIYDSDWNPQCDLQAMARCHRIGQTRPVVVYRLCTKGTIDERIINRAAAKRKLEKIIISKETNMELKDANTLLELKRLLETNESEIVSAEKEVYTEAELDKILDRSDLVWPVPKEKSQSAETASSL